MKAILITLASVGILYYVLVNSFGLKSEVVTPEIKRTGSYERPVKDGNCYIQTDSTGNKIRVCG